MPNLLPNFQDVLDAAQRLQGVAHRTPVLQSGSLNRQLQAQVFIKCENFQRMGAFKFRGGFNALAKLNEAERQAGVVAYSSGNHAQAVALSARILNMPATIFLPHDASPAKLAATQSYGATVMGYDRYSEDASAKAMQLAQEKGLKFIPPFDHADVLAGQGTAALELFDEVGELDALFVWAVEVCSVAVLWQPKRAHRSAKFTALNLKQAMTRSSLFARASASKLQRLSPSQMVPKHPWWAPSRLKSSRPWSMTFTP